MDDLNDNTEKAKTKTSLKEKSDDVLQSLGISNLEMTSVINDADINIHRKKCEKKRIKRAKMKEIEKE